MGASANLETESKMKEAIEESSDVIKISEKEEGIPCTSCVKEEGKDESKRKKAKCIRFVEPTKEEKHSIPSSESSEEEFDSSSEENRTSKNIFIEETSSEGSDSSVSKESDLSKEEESSSESERKKVVNIPVRQVVPESLKPPQVRKEDIETESERESSSEKESSSATNESEENVPYVKLDNSPPLEEHSPENEKYITENTAETKGPGLDVVNKASTVPNIQRRKKVHGNRIFEKVPNQNAVYVPLHGSSDEELSEEGPKDSHKSDETTCCTETCEEFCQKKEWNELPNEYSIFVPLHGRPNENLENENNKRSEDNDRTIERHEESENNKNIKPVTFASESYQPLKMKKHKPRMFYKVPNENAVIIPLHGSSDEDIDRIDTKEGSTMDEAEIEESSDLNKSKELLYEKKLEDDEPNKYAVIVSLHKSTFEKEDSCNTEEFSKIVNEEKMYTEAAKIIQEEAGVSISAEHEIKEIPKRVKNRIFTKVPNENAVFVPLHGSSDDEESSVKDSDACITSAAPQEKDEKNYVSEHSKLNHGGHSSYAEPPNEYSVFVPLHGWAGEEVPIEVDAEQEKAQASELPNLGETKILPDEKSFQQSEDDQEEKLVIHKQRLFLKVPGQNAVIIPLHGSSDEEDRQDVEEDDGLTSALHSSPSTEKHSQQGRKYSKHFKNREVIYEGAPNEYGIIVPLAGFPNEEENLTEDAGNFVDNTEVPSQFYEVEKSLQEVSKTEEPEREDTEMKPIKKKQRVFLKVPNQNAVFVPLHGSSDEEEILESTQIDDLRGRSDSVCETPKIQTIQRIYSGAPNEYAIFVPLHGCPEEQGRVSSEVEGLQSETSNIGSSTNIKEKQKTTDVSNIQNRDGTTKMDEEVTFKVPEQNATLIHPRDSSAQGGGKSIDDDDDDGLVQSDMTVPKEIGSSINRLIGEKEPEIIAGSSKVIESQIRNENDDRGKIKKKIKMKERLFLKIPNQDAVIVPLHGSSDEEENSESSEERRQLKKERVEVEYNQAPNEYGMLVPLHGLPGELNVHELNVPEVDGAQENNSPVFKNFEKQPSEQPDSKDTDIKTKEHNIHKPRLFYKIPNENAFFVPLHGSSDEEEEGNVNSLEKYSNTASDPLEKEQNISRKIDYEAPNEYGIIVPLHQFPYEPKYHENEPNTSLEPSSMANVSTEEITNVSEKNIEKENSFLEKFGKKKQRIFTKVANQDAVYIPLHGSSDEEKSYEEETSSNIEPSTMNQSFSLIKERTRMEEETEKKKLKLKTEYTGAPNEYAMFVPLHGTTEEYPDELKDTKASSTNAVKSEDIEVKEQKSQEITAAKRNENKSNIIEKKSIIMEPNTSDKKETNSSLGEQSEQKDLKPKVNRPKGKKKAPPERKEIATVTTDSVAKSSEVPPLTKEKVTMKKAQMPFKMADVVLQVIAKEEKKELETLSTLQKIPDDPGEKNECQAAEQKTSQAEETQKNIGDHEYEPIQVPRSASQPPDSGRSYKIETRSHPVEVITQAPVPEAESKAVESKSRHIEVNLKHEEEDRYEIVRPKESISVQENSANLQAEGGYEAVEEPKKQEPKRYIRIPNEDAIIVPLHGSSDEDINPDRYLNPALMMSEEEIEHLPQTMSFNETLQEIPQDKSNTRDTIQQKFKAQTDRLTTKLKGISKPNINFNKPKINLPERPNIKMPEIPKIKLPERPKFSFPDSSKFHLPERPKFHFPDRPKFHMPEKPKFLTEKPKFLTERPKFKLPERPKFSRGEKKPKGPKGKKPNPSSLRRPLRDVVTISSQSTPGSTNNIFETLKFRTYPRFFKKKKAPPVQKMSSLDTESSQPSTPPMRPRSYSGQQQDTSWVHAYRDVKFADEDSNLRVERMEEEYEKEENTAQFHENYDGRARNMAEEDYKQGKAESMTSVVSEKGSSGSSSNRRRAGVIEEIDSDEFFVREKGLSREDVDVSRYLSLEIRDAFRQPKNALASLDSELYDDEEPEMKFEHSPRAPQRTKPGKSASFEREQEFHTFPKRPSRRKESDPEIVVKPPRRFRSSSKSGSRYRSRQSSMPSLNSDIDMGAPEPPRRKSRERSIKSLNREGQVSYHGDDNVQNRVSAQHSVEISPVAPLRKSRSRGTSLADDDRTSRGADSLILPDDDDVHHPNHVEREDDDEEIMIDDEEPNEKFIEEEEPYKEVESATIKETIQVEEKVIDNSGYAVVSKDKKKPPRPPPPPHQPFHFQSQLDTIKNTGKQIFFTYPRRAIKSLHKQPPARPVRNYSTLGPVRPPRKNRVFRQPLYMTGDNLSPQDSSVDKERDLQSGDILNKMKGRPLPPPPRPPRKTKDFDNFIGSEIAENIPTETIIATTEIEIEEEFEPEVEEDRISYLKSKKDTFFSTLSKYTPRSGEKKENLREVLTQTSEEGQTTTGQQTSFDYGDVSIQTDPLPKGCIIIDQEIEETEEILILPDNSKEIIEDKEEKPSISEGFQTRSPAKLEERRVVESIQKKEESDRESPETNIFQHALERVEAARGVLKEARERVIPGSTSSLDERRPVEEKQGPVVRVLQSEALPTSERSDDVEKEGTPPPLPIRPMYTKPIPVSFPDKLHLSELEVDTLNVSEIQANKIKVSEIESTCIEVTELTSRGGNLMLNGVELPPDFITNIVAQVAAQQAQQQQNMQPQCKQPQQASRESTPQRQMRRVLTPPPSILVHATSEKVTLPEPKLPETLGTEHIPQPKTTRSKGRKLQTRVIDDSEDELASTLTQRREKEEESKKKCEGKIESRSDDSLGPRLTQASSVQLMGRLFSIWQDNVVQGTGIFVQGVNSLFPEGEKRRDAQIAAVILLILVTGLILVGFGFDNSVHHHHWDYLPPR